MIGYAVLIGRSPLQIEIDGFCGSSTSLISLILKEKGCVIVFPSGKVDCSPPFRLRDLLPLEAGGLGTTFNRSTRILVEMEKDKIRFFNWM